MQKLILLTAGLLLCALVAAAKSSPVAGEPGPFKLIACHGATEPYAVDPSLTPLGAYTVWCYDDRGRAAVRMDHGPVAHAYPPQPVGPDNPVIDVSFTHFDDADRDGVLEADGFLRLWFVANEESLMRATVVPDFVNPLQGLSIVESPESEIKASTGWFAGTRQVINRTNVRVRVDAQGMHVTHANWSVLTFVRNPVTMAVP
jgi:hypothetical protein